VEFLLILSEDTGLVATEQEHGQAGARHERAIGFMCACVNELWSRPGS
jgi:hypothetical protein